MSDGAALRDDGFAVLAPETTERLAPHERSGAGDAEANGRRPARVRVERHRLADGCSLVLAPGTSRADADALVIVLGGGRGCLLRCEAAWAGAFIPLRGRLQFHGGRGDCVLNAGAFRITEADPALQASGRGNALWVAVLGGRGAWRRALAPFHDAPAGEPALLPALHEADRDVRRRAAALARTVPGGAYDDVLDALLDRIVATQAALGDTIARCPGRTYAQKRAVFLRLQRVRNYIAANCHLEIDNEALACMANYSLWHFIRAFRAAYRQTPHAYLIDERLRRARRLLRSSPLAIAEVALASGFENRCAFSRLFRQRFGTTAGAVRRAS